MRQRRFEADHSRCIGPTEISDLHAKHDDLALLSAYLRRQLREAHAWMPLLGQATEGPRPKELVGSLRKVLRHVDSRRQAVAKSEGFLPLKREDEPPNSTTARPYAMRWMDPHFAEILASPVIRQAQAAAGACPSNLIYIDWPRRPADFRELYHDPPLFEDQNNTRGGRQFWLVGPAANATGDKPTVRVQEPVDSTGVAFEISVFEDSAPTLGQVAADIGVAVLTSGVVTDAGTDKVNGIGTCFLFKYAFAPAPCNMTYHWSAQTYFTLPHGIAIDGETLYASFEAVTYQGPNGEGFPSWEQLTFHPGKYPSASTTSRISKSNTIYGQMNVNSGVAPTLYVGLSVKLMVLNGAICVSDCITSPSETPFDNGLFDIEGVIAVGVPR